jgi:polyisoprenoid-binding protein YceI
LAASPHYLQHCNHNSQARHDAHHALLLPPSCWPRRRGPGALGPSGRADVSRVTGGTYKVDPDHTHAIWTVDHLGVSPLSGMFGKMSGTLTLTPKRPAAAQLNIEFR